MGVGGARGKKESVQEGAGSVNTQTGPVRVAASQSNNVIRETSWEEPGEPATDANLGATTDASLGTTTDASVKYNKSTMEGGGSVNTQTDTSSFSKFRNFEISKLYSTPRKHNISSKGGNNESIFTPTKRKLISEGNIQNLIGKFEVNSKSKSSKESDICESPAKRGRWGPWGD